MGGLLRTLTHYAIYAHLNNIFATYVDLLMFAIACSYRAGGSLVRPIAAIPKWHDKQYSWMVIGIQIESIHLGMYKSTSKSIYLLNNI